MQQLADELWGDCDGKTVTEHAFGKGKVICGKTPEAVLAEMGVPPDFRAEKLTSQTPTSRYIHRAADGADIYFVSNASPRTLDAECTFRVKGKRPEFWHPDTGRVEPVAVYQEIEGGTRIPIWFDAGGSVFVVFRPVSSGGKEPDPVVAISRDGKPVMGSSRPAAKIVVQNAVYGVLKDAARTRNVTARIKRMVRQGEYSFRVARMAEDGDPAFGIVKTLTVEYTVNGKPCRTSATDPETIQLLGGEEPRDAEVRYDGGRLVVEAAKPGRYELKTASGKTADVEVPAVPAAIDVAGPWKLQFPSGWGAPKSVTLDKLISWSKHPNAGVKYFSGTATYLKTIQVPADMIAKEPPRLSRPRQGAGDRPGETQRQGPRHPLEAALPRRRDRRRPRRRQHAGGRA